MAKRDYDVKDPSLAGKGRFRIQWQKTICRSSGRFVLALKKNSL